MSGRTHDVSISGFDLDRLEAGLAKAVRERDEALAKIERQAERIRYLEGATNHACGTPLTIALRERDEAREDADSWKVEYEIVAARLRGEKHHRDNGIVSEDEIIPKLIRERDEARASLAQLHREQDFRTACVLDQDRRMRSLPASAGDASPSRVARGNLHEAGVVGALRERLDRVTGLLRDVERETRRPSERFDEVWAEVREVLRG